MALLKARRTYQEVMAACERERKNDVIVHRLGQCLGTSRQLYGLPGMGIYDAAEAIRKTSKLYKTGTPPAGAHLLWSGGSRGHGHSAISAGGGMCYSVDIGGSARLYKCAISTISRKWDLLTYRGWATDYCGRYALNVKIPVSIPNLRLSYFNAARSEIDKPRTSKLHPATVRIAEASLADFGCGPGPIDGHYGTSTDSAVREFQTRVCKDKSDGRLGPKQWARLGAGPKGKKPRFTAVA